MAKTITEAFEDFASNLEITDLQSTAASKRQQTVREAIESRMTVKDSFLTGSYMRSTMIAPLTEADIDIFVVLHGDYFGQNSQSELLDTVVDVLKERYTTPKISPNGQAVTIKFKKFCVDVVPGFNRKGGGYLIPDTSHLRWIPTDPKSHVEIWSEANKKSGGLLVPTIKMIKAWNKKRNLLRSFHLECMILESFEGYDVEFDDYPSALAHFFEVGMWLLRLGVDDPAGYGGKVGDYLGQSSISTVSSRMQAALDHARQADELDRRGRVSAAIDHWRIVFGDYFPAYG